MSATILVEPAPSAAVAAREAPRADPARTPRRTHGGGALVVGVVAAITLAIYLPLLRSGTVLLLDFADYPIGPHSALGRYAWGFTPGLTIRAPINAVLLALFRGIPFEQVRILPLLAAPALAAWGFHRLFRGLRLATVTATLLFVVNPFLYERILGGQIYFVVAVAALPLFLSLLEPIAGSGRAIAAGLTWAALIALSPHMVFVGGLLFVSAAFWWSRAKGWRATAGHWAVCIVAAIGASLYWIVPVVSRASDLERVTGTDLRTFATMGDRVFGLFANVAGLYGFWRPGPPLPKESLPAWPLLLAAILTVSALGYLATRRGPRAPLANLLVSAGAVALFLAAGTQGPTGGVYRALFDHAIGFRIMREPEKFSAVLLLAYAGLFGAGIESFVQASRGRSARVATVALTSAVVCAYTFRMFGGFAGYVEPSRFPSSWYEAESLMGAGSSKVLELPGDQYVSYPWTQDRAVANPAPSFFSRDVVIDGSIGLGAIESQTSDARARYVRFIEAHGSETTRFGRLIAPLGVRYVLLSKTGNWAAAGWLRDQVDLRLVQDWDDLALFENEEPISQAYAPSAGITVNDWGEVVGLAEVADLTDLAVTVRHPAPGPVRLPSARIPDAGTSPTTVLRSSPVGLSANVPSGSQLITTEPFDPAWAANGVPAQPQLGVTTSVRAGTGTTVVDLRYGRWPLVRASYVASGLAVGLSIIAALVIRRRARRLVDVRTAS